MRIARHVIFDNSNMNWNETTKKCLMTNVFQRLRTTFRFFSVMFLLSMIMNLQNDSIFRAFCRETCWKFVFFLFIVSCRILQPKYGCSPPQKSKLYDQSIKLRSNVCDFLQMLILKLAIYPIKKPKL